LPGDVAAPEHSRRINCLIQVGERDLGLHHFLQDRSDRRAALLGFYKGARV
jgi:hypothetical protein